MKHAKEAAWQSEERHYEIMREQLQSKEKIEGCNKIIKEIEEEKTKQTITFAGGHTYEIPQKQDEETGND